MLDLSVNRAQFPALNQTQDGKRVVFFDNPGGTQCPQRVIEAVSGYLAHDNANHGGAFATSQRSDAMLHDAHQAMADMLGAASADGIIFGANMTTLTFGVSRALGRELKPGDEIVITQLDHDANVSPWLLLARDTGAVIRWVDIREEDVTLDMASFEAAITDKTKIVAAGYASNAVGTINDVKTIVDMAHAADALTYIDAVQYAPHGPIDVQSLGCDFLVCSAYKFFGPHVGILYGKLDLLDRLSAYKVRPADDRPPYKFETGTLNHEGIAGTRAAVEYLGQVSNLKSQTPALRAGASVSNRRERVVAGMTVIKEYEQMLSARLISGLQQIKGLRIWGITDLARLDRRVPTVSFTLEGHRPREVAEYLGRRGIFVWDGNYYALAVMERLRLEETGGMVRVGLAHYNTIEEIDRLVSELETFVG
jgi:cysteine desulfurase family protein (TIGR01976 family)